MLFVCAVPTHHNLWPYLPLPLGTQSQSPNAFMLFTWKDIWLVKNTPNISTNLAGKAGWLHKYRE